MAAFVCEIYHISYDAILVKCTEYSLTCPSTNLMDLAITPVSVIETNFIYAYYKTHKRYFIQYIDLDTSAHHFNDLNIDTGTSRCKNIII